ncbi:MAG: hypothetical protein RL272_1267 [Candidatus Parcubacteria bacterium]|jgi:hypothetical protein
MKNGLSIVSLILIIPILIVSAWLANVVVGCIIAAFIILGNAFFTMATEDYEPTRCETCGQVIEEGADMALEDEFNDIPQ